MSRLPNFLYLSSTHPKSLVDTKMIIGTKIWCIFAFVILTHAAGFLPDLGEFGHPVRRIGAGSASSVYLYRVVLPRQDKDTSKSFAVKIFDPKNPHESRAAYEERIRLESFLARTLGETHHGFVQVHDLLMRNGSWYQIMDYHPYALLPMLAESPMDLDQVACLFKQICEAVYAMHVEMGIAHRDLKLDNVVLSHEGVVKIIDFGGALVGRFPLQPRHEVIQGHGTSTPGGQRWFIIDHEPQALKAQNLTLRQRHTLRRSMIHSKLTFGVWGSCCMASGLGIFHGIGQTWMMERFESSIQMTKLS